MIDTSFAVNNSQPHVSASLLLTAVKQLHSPTYSRWSTSVWTLISSSSLTWPTYIWTLTNSLHRSARDLSWALYAFYWPQYVELIAVFTTSIYIMITNLFVILRLSSFSSSFQLRTFDCSTIICILGRGIYIKLKRKR